MNGGQPVSVSQPEKHECCGAPLIAITSSMLLQISSAVEFFFSGFCNELFFFFLMMTEAFNVNFEPFHEQGDVVVDRGVGNYGAARTQDKT